MLRVYVSGPMSGLPEFNFPAFHAVAAALRAKGFEFYDWAPGEIRLVFAWDTPEAHLDALTAALAEL
jgi:hypothetical protein